MVLERISFDDLLSRADDETLQQLVGVSAVRLLNALDPNLTKLHTLREICLRLHSREELLRSPITRMQLLPLLPVDQAHSLAETLELKTDYPYQRLLEVGIRKNSRIERKLFSFLSVVENNNNQTNNGYPNPIVSHPAQYGLFDHQRHAQQKVLEVLGGTKPRVILHMPTGAGKTRTAMHVITTMLRQREPCLAVWLAYSEELCSQAVEEFQQAWSNLGNRNINIYRFWGAGCDLDINDLHDGFVVAGLGKIYERAKRDADFISRLADRTILVIMDEAHQAIAETYKFLLDYLVERDGTTRLLGLTATPGRTWNDPAIDEQLALFFNKQKVTLKVAGYDNPVDYLIDNKYLANPSFYPLKYKPSNQEPFTEAQLQALASQLDIPISILERLAADENRNLSIISKIESLVKHHKRILVFAATVKHAKLLATVLQARNVDATTITSMTPSGERNRIVTRYKNNDSEPRVLCNYGVLTAGFDAPQTSAAVIARPTRSLVLYSQMVGRATRGPLAGGNERAEIHTVVDTQLPGFGNLSEAFRNWEDVWDD